MSSDVKHDYHLVDPSPWPVVGSIGAFTMMVGAVFWMNKDYTGFWGLPVNGTPVDSIERGQQIMSSLGSASSVRVTVLRAGKPTEITVGLR